MNSSEEKAAAAAVAVEDAQVAVHLLGHHRRAQALPGPPVCNRPSIAPRTPISTNHDTGGKGGSTAGTASSSNAGGRSATGSGVAPSFGRGSFYGGGASVPYSSGLRSPLGITPFLFAGTALVGVAALSGVWLYGVYSYPYHQSIVFNNASAANATNPNGVNQTHPVDCLCQQYSVCGCDDNTNSTYIDSLLGNGSYNALNHSLVAVSDNGTIYINGSLP